MIRNASAEPRGNTPRHSRARVAPLDRRDPGALFVEQEIAADRRAERWLWLKAAVALALVGCLVVARQVFFA